MSWMVLAYSFLIDKTRQETLALSDKIRHTPGGRLDLFNSSENQRELKQPKEKKYRTYIAGEMSAAEGQRLSPRRNAGTSTEKAAVERVGETELKDRRTAVDSSEVKKPRTASALEQSDSWENGRKNVEGTPRDQRQSSKMVKRSREHVGRVGDSRFVLSERGGKRLHALGDAGAAEKPGEGGELAPRQEVKKPQFKRANTEGDGHTGEANGIEPNEVERQQASVQDEVQEDSQQAGAPNSTDPIFSAGGGSRDLPKANDEGHLPDKRLGLKEREEEGRRRRLSVVASRFPDPVVPQSVPAPDELGVLQIPASEGQFSSSSVALPVSGPTGGAPASSSSGPVPSSSVLSPTGALVQSPLPHPRSSSSSSSVFELLPDARTAARRASAAVPSSSSAVPSSSAILPTPSTARLSSESNTSPVRPSFSSSSPPRHSLSSSASPSPSPGSGVSSLPIAAEAPASSASVPSDPADSSPWLLQDGALASLPVLPLVTHALRVDVFLLTIGPLLVLVLLLCFAISVVSLQREVVGDREEGRRAVMTAMGMHPLAYYVAW